MHAKEKAILLLIGTVTSVVALQSALPAPARTHFSEAPIEIVSTLGVQLPSTAPEVDESADTTSGSEQAAPTPAVTTPDPEPVAATPESEPGVAPATETDTTPAVAASGGSGVVEVVFSFEGDGSLPDRQVSESAAIGCHADGSPVDVNNRSLIVNGGKVQYVVVTLEPRGHEPVVPLRAEPQLLDQIGCRFEPHVLVVREGESVSYRNSDGVNHNVNLKAKKNPKFSETVSPDGARDSEVSRAEDFEVRCDIHPWMNAQVMVVEQPYFAVSGTDGSLRIEGVAAGEYRVEYWHETLGKGRIEDISVADGEVVNLEMTLSGGGGGGGGRRRGR